jgi:signal transduction histidine kinase
MSLHGAIVVRDDTTGIEDLGDLRGRTVAVMKNDNAEEFLRREERGINIVATATFEQALRELSEGRHDAVVVQRLVALRLIQAAGHSNLRIVNRPIEDFRQDFCFAVRKGDSETLALLNEGLALVMADGTYHYLHAKWFAALELPTDRRIVVGGDEDYPPFEYLDEEGRPTGYGVELTRAIALALGLDVEIRLGPWDEIRESLANGEIDLIQGIYYTPERDLIYDFGPAHWVAHHVGVARRGEGPLPDSPDDLVGKRLVVQRGDLMHDFLVEQEVQAELTLVDSQGEALEQLAEGRHDYALVSRPTALYLIEKEGWTDLVVGRTSLYPADYCFAVLSGHGALLAEFSEGLAIVRNTGDLRRIQEKWLGVYEQPTVGAATVIRYAAYVVGPLLFLLLAALLWSRSLRRQVARRTEELRGSEERLRQSQKMEAVGQLAGGIAHDFNNLLTAIIGYSELVLSDAEFKKTAWHEDVREIRAAADKAGSLTQQILAFSRRQVLQPKVVSLNDLIEEMTPLLRRTLGEDMELVISLGSDLGLTEVDPHQFAQVLMNLAVNSRDAMPSGWVLSFATANTRLDDRDSANDPDLRPGSYVTLSVSDTGTGIDPDVIEHIFEPFYTSKDVGKGTGLGLSTVYGIVKQSGGAVTVESTAGKGTTFVVYLPRADDESKSDETPLVQEPITA